MSANWKYRQSLTHIKENNIIENSSQTVIQPINSPFLYTSCADVSQPNGYENSNLKQAYLFQRQIKSTMISPEIHVD